MMILEHYTRAQMGGGQPQILSTSSMGSSAYSDNKAIEYKNTDPKHVDSNKQSHSRDRY